MKSAELAGVPANPCRILIRATNWLGDAVMSLPAIRAVRARFPEAQITVLARPWVADLYARETFADSVVVYPAARGLRGLAAKYRAASQLSRLSFDCAILLPNSFDAAASAWLAGIPHRIGYNRDGRGLLLTAAIPPPAQDAIPRHESYYYLELLRRAGLLDRLPETVSIRLEGIEALRATGLSRFTSLGAAGGVVGVSPGAAYGGAKRWFPERFAEAAARVSIDTGSAVALFGSAAERTLCDSVEQMLHRRVPAVYNLAGQTTLREFIELAAACRVFLTNDSGAMHIASAAGVPTVAVFGATDHIATGPSSELARVVREPVECSPCLLRECPIDHRCMSRVSAERVAATALELLK